MKRNQLSGSQKRKLAEEKKQNVSETVADYAAPNNKNNSERENVDEKEIEAAHPENY